MYSSSSVYDTDGEEDDRGHPRPAPLLLLHVTSSALAALAAQKVHRI